jgi:hypothetical protein
MLGLAPWRIAQTPSNLFAARMAIIQFGLSECKVAITDLQTLQKMSAESWSMLSVRFQHAKISGGTFLQASQYTLGNRSITPCLFSWHTSPLGRVARHRRAQGESAGFRPRTARPGDRFAQLIQ